MKSKADWSVPGRRVAQVIATSLLATVCCVALLCSLRVSAPAHAGVGEGLRSGQTEREVDSPVPYRFNHPHAIAAGDTFTLALQEDPYGLDPAQDLGGKRVEGLQLECVAPTILQVLGVDIPETMETNPIAY